MAGFRKTQILLTQKNSAWGVIVNPVSSNVYQHILSWDSEEIKDNFIQKYLMTDNDENWKDLIRKSPNVSLTILTDLKAKIKFDSKTYPNMSKREIMNKDFAIVLETDENGNETFWYYAITMLPITTPNIYEFNAELDIFFTYNVKEMFKDDSQVQFSRGMLDRLKSKTDTYPKIDINDLRSYGENFDNDFTAYITEKNLYTHNDVYSYLYTKPFFTIEDKKVAGYEFYKISSEKSYDSDYSINAEYKFNPDRIILDLNKEEIKNVKEAIINSPFSFTGEMRAPIPLNTDNFKDIEFSVNARTNNGTSITIHSFSIPTLDVSGNITIHISNIISKNFSGIDNINTPYNWEWETKIYTPPYKNIVVYNHSGDNYELSLYYLDNDFFISWHIFFSQMQIFNKLFFKGKFYNPDYNFPASMEWEYNYSGEQIISAEDQYLAYNKAQLQNSIKIANKHSRQAKSQGALKVIGGILKTGASFATGNVGGIVNGAQGIASGGTDIANAENEIHTIQAQQEDLKNAPATINNSTTLYNMLQRLPIYTKFLSINLETLPEKFLKAVASYFQVAGYNLGTNLLDLNPMLDNRYYFNYVKTQSVFELFKMELSSPIKQMIDNTFKNGIHIWHIRDLETFKGIRNYNVNNVEMSFLNE